MTRLRIGNAEPGIYARLLGNWGLGLAGLPFSLTVEERRCPLRPLAEEIKRVATGGTSRTGHGPR